MLRYERSAPIWLFSFVDLAFLLLIAFTQIGPDPSNRGPTIAELEIPRIAGPGQPLASGDSEAAWQLRVYPPDAGKTAEARAASGPRPYALLEPLASDATATAKPIDVGDLKAHLELLRTRDSGKPILAPHRDARAEDLLVAVSLLEDIWKSNRTVAIRPDAAVSAGPDDEAP